MTEKCLGLGHLHLHQVRMPSGRGKTRNIRAALSARDVADLRISELQQQLLETRQDMQQQNNKF